MALLDDAVSADQAQSRAGCKARPPRPLGRIARSSRVLDALVGKFLDAIAAALAGCDLCHLLSTRRFLSWTSARALGRQWRIDAGLNPDHQLVRSGGYGVVRHPIYTSMFCMLLGT